MPKNVIVVDELGNEYEATYPRRAKGLVKNGRARFVDENKICLVCPPDRNETEDRNMPENIAKTEAAESASLYNIEYILERIAEIQKETAYLNEVAAKLAEMTDGDSGDCGAPGNIQGQAKAQGLADIVRCRETTNQQLLRLYEKMYDNLAAFRLTSQFINK